MPSSARMSSQHHPRARRGRTATPLLPLLLALACPLLSPAADTPAKVTRPAAAKTAAPAPRPAPVTLELTYPAGKSPKVFTAGWVFGARVVDRSGPAPASRVIRWSGTGTFQPSEGEQSRPVFAKPGPNRITLTLVENGKVVTEKSFTVDAVDPKTYARIGDQACCSSYAFGCPTCPHVVRGPITTGSPNVFIGGKPAARVGDQGLSPGGCAGDTFTVKSGDPSVLIDGKPAARLNDPTLHSGHLGKIDGLIGR